MFKHVNFGTYILMHTSEVKRDMLIIKFHPGMNCLHAFFPFFFIPGWNFIPVFLRVRLHVIEMKSHPEMEKFMFTRQFHPGMKRVEFRPGMKLNLKENLPLSMMKTYNKIFHFYSIIESEAWYVKNIRRLKARCTKWLRLTRKNIY